MKHQKFVKQLMSMGISRNTAEAAAAAASRAEIPLVKTACRVQAMRRIFGRDLERSKYWRQQFDQILRAQAEMTPRRIRPLAKKNRRLDGLRADLVMVDEWSGQGGGGHD